MSFLKRLSDGIVSWVSPRKTDPPAHPARTPPTPHTVPPFRKLQQRSNDYTFDRAIRNSRSMSPVERVDSWQMSEDDALAVGSKRKLLPTPGASDGDGGRVKRAKYEGHDDDGDVSMGDEEEELEEEVGSDEELEEVGSEQSGGSEVDDDQVEGGYDDDEEGDEDSGQQYDQDDEAEEYVEDDQDDDEDEEDADEPYDANALTQDFSALKHSSSLIKEEPIDDDSEPVIDQDISNIIPEDNYEQNKPRVIDITQEHLYRGIDTAKLRADGWCDDHITLVQKLAMRGFEPLMPLVFRDLLSYLPHALFARSPEEYQASYIQSGKGDRMNYALSKYLDKFMILGGYVRSRANEDPEKLPTGKDLDTRRYSPHVRKTSEWTIINGVLEFMKYAEERDQPGLETRKKQPTCRIPILAQVAAPPGTPPAEMQERAQLKMEVLYQRYEEKFRVHQSIEQSPGSTSTTSPTSALTGERLAYPIPQIYCLIATGTVVVLAAYRPDDREMPVQTTAFFDFKEHGYDAWNVLALALIVCHCRRVLVRIAAETGVGAFVPGTEDPVYDPDL